MGPIFSPELQTFTSGKMYHLTKKALAIEINKHGIASAAAVAGTIPNTKGAVPREHLHFMVSGLEMSATSSRGAPGGSSTTASRSVQTVAAKLELSFALPPTVT